jgi:hypothetical protein
MTCATKLAALPSQSIDLLPVLHELLAAVLWDGSSRKPGSDLKVCRQQQTREHELNPCLLEQPQLHHWSPLC